MYFITVVDIDNNIALHYAASMKNHLSIGGTTLHYVAIVKCICEHISKLLCHDFIHL